MATERFELQRDEESVIWASQERNTVTIFRTDLRAGRDTVLLTLDRDRVRDLLVWADGARAVTASITGPLAREVREGAKQLSLSPEIFVWHAVKTFLEAAREASHGH